MDIWQRDVSIVACTPDGVMEYYAAGRSLPQPAKDGTIVDYNAEGHTMSCRFKYDNAIARGLLDQVASLTACRRAL